MVVNLSQIQYKICVLTCQVSFHKNFMPATRWRVQAHKKDAAGSGYAAPAASLRVIIRSVKESLLVNTLGQAAGVLIFGIFLYLLIQDRAARRLPGSTKSMLAAALALAWNLASLIALGTNAPESASAKVIAAIGFSVLSLLPAVLFDLCLKDRYRVLVRLGYGLSA